MTAEGRPEDLLDPPAIGDTEKISESVPRPKCCAPNLKMFIGILGLWHFSKTMTGSYMKSSITQIERRFEIPSSTVGIIDCSFEMGNLLVITIVSYFGAKYHRPRLIATGVLLTSVGTLLMAAPHFLMGRYEYESVANPSQEEMPGNVTVFVPCSTYAHSKLEQPIAGCQEGRGHGSPMWIMVLVANMLRGIGDSVGPLGLAFIDDYARPENSAFYIGCLHTIAVIGPLFGYMLGSLCAKLYVDIGFVDLDRVSITTQDSRWVGTWWLGFLVAGGFNLLVTIPFWFFPRALPEDGQAKHVSSREPIDQHKPNLLEIAKGFLPSLKALFTNKIYVLYVLSNILIYKAFVITITYLAKYYEQQFGLSASTANFLLGVTSMPPVILGIFFSGVIMKHFKLDMLGAARVGFWTAIAGFLCTLPFFTLSCQNADVAGLTVPYPGSEQLIGLQSSCNSACLCPDNQWDPVCALDGVTYISPCFAGCSSTSGLGRNMTFHGCSCILSAGANVGDDAAILGQCPREEKCSKMFYIFLALQSVSFLFYSLGSTPIFIISLRSVEPELKSLSAGIFFLALRVLGGIPAPIYFGAVIDSTCLKWGSRKCGGRGACRLYNIQTLRYLFLCTVSFLRLFGCVVLWMTVMQIKNKTEQQQKNKESNEDLEMNLKQTNSNSSLDKEIKTHCTME